VSVDTSGGRRGDGEVASDVASDRSADPHRRVRGATRSALSGEITGEVSEHRFAEIFDFASGMTETKQEGRPLAALFVATRNSGRFVERPELCRGLAEYTVRMWIVQAEPGLLHGLGRLLAWEPGGLWRDRPGQSLTTFAISATPVAPSDAPSRAGRLIVTGTCRPRLDAGRRLRR